MKAVSPQNDNLERLNVLLTDGGQPWAEHLPRLLEPQGVRAIRVSSVNEAVEAMEEEPIHAAVVDLALPMSPGASNRTSRITPCDPNRLPDGMRLVQLMKRLDPAPPAVIVRGRFFDRRSDDRLLAEALKLDVFSVLDRPVELEMMLDVLRRLLDRFYGGHWPAS